MYSGNAVAFDARNLNFILPRTDSPRIETEPKARKLSCHWTNSFQPASPWHGRRKISRLRTRHNPAKLPFVGFELLAPGPLGCGVQRP